MSKSESLADMISNTVLTAIKGNVITKPMEENNSNTLVLILFHE